MRNYFAVLLLPLYLHAYKARVSESEWEGRGGGIICARSKEKWKG